MASGPLPDVLRHIRELVDVSDRTDEELLARFVDGRDAAAFEALVRRHAPLVLGVCRRRLPRPQDVEDAFQATFVVLLRKAATVRGRLPCWLYGVANRVALRARAARAHAPLPADGPVAPEPPCEVSRQELRALLDEEVARLPEKYRAPLLLCHLQDKTQEQAAGILGWPRGTVATRVTRALHTLRGRLARRGVALSAGALAAEAGAAVPPHLLSAALRVSQGVTGPAAALAEAALAPLLSPKLKLAGAVLLTLGALGAGALAYRGPATPAPPRPAAALAPAAAPPAWAEGRRFRVLPKDGHVSALAFSPDGRSLASAGSVQDLAPFFAAEDTFAVPLWEVATGRKRGALSRGRNGAFSGISSIAFSPDGKSVATTETALYLWDRQTGAFRALCDPWLSPCYAAFAPDGKALASVHVDGAVRLFDLPSGKLRATLGGHHLPFSAVAFPPAGNTVVTAGGEGAVRVWDRFTGEPLAAHPVPLASAWHTALAPDGRVVAFCSLSALTVDAWDVSGGRRVARLACPAQPSALAYSPDGRTLAAGCADGTVLLWETAGWRQLARFGGAAQVTALAFRRDGRGLGGADLKGFVRLWTDEAGKP